MPASKGTLAVPDLNKPVRDRIGTVGEHDHDRGDRRLRCQRRLHSANETLTDRAIVCFTSGQQDGDKAPFNICKS